ncbi:MAG: phosphatidylserine/phosphatidylglycerophosphate/cardiolipin synthase family protein [Candidatus Paceibacterota bacterium]
MKKYKLYTHSEKAFDAMLYAVKNAEQSIYWESYIFNNDLLLTHDFFSVFKNKAKAGVKVVFILDGLGSYGIAKEAIEDLKKAGVEVYFFTSWWRRTHRKLLIVDDRVAFLGGVNVGHAYRKWLDLHLRTTESALLPVMIHSFAKSYAMCGGRDQSVLAERNTRKTVRETKLKFFEHWPIFGKLRLRELYEERVEHAKKSIVIVSPYFIPHTWLRKALLAAVNRGVKVSIIIPEHTDPAIGDISNYYIADLLTPCGIHFFLQTQMNHAKALLVDDEEAMIGSHNIDALSFDFNQEAGVFFNKKDMVRDLKKIISKWQEDSTPFEKIVWHRRWYYPLVSLIVRLAQPVS